MHCLSQVVHQYIDDLKSSFNVAHFSEIPAPLRPVFVKVAMFVMTKSLYTRFNYGFEQKIFLPDNNPYPEFKYIVENQDVYPIECHKHRSWFDMNYFNQNEIVKSHRSGWQFVMDHLQQYSSSDNDLLFDTSLDRTFGWELDTLKRVGIVPYRKPWIGVIHHTFDTTFTEYNLTNIFRNNDFLESLGACRGLIVMTKYLREQVRSELRGVSLHIPVHVIYHPTALDIPEFTGPKNTLVHVGGFLRDIFFFYRLQLNGIQKQILNKPDLFAFIPGDVDIDVDNEDEGHCVTSCSSIFSKGFFQRRLEDYIEKILSSVEHVPKLSDDEYDAFLTDKVVFLKLVDASACNTVMECVARNVPLIVNRHPAIQEILGANYPLFYDNNATPEEVSRFVEQAFYNNGQMLHLASDIMRHLDKSQYSIHSFIAKMEFIINSLDYVTCSDGSGCSPPAHTRAPS